MLARVVIEHPDAGPVGPDEPVARAGREALGRSAPGECRPAQDANIATTRSSESQSLRRAEFLKQTRQILEAAHAPDLGMPLDQ